MKKSIALLLVFAMILSSFAVLGQAEQNPKKKYTIMLYMCGSNLESKDGQMSADIMSIIQSRYNTEEINVVALLGGARVWQTGYSNKQLTVLEIGNRRPVVADQLPLTSMGDENTLSNFINYCYEKYPAENYILDLVDHGGGPINGLMDDELFDGDGMSMLDVASALENSSIKNQKLEMIIMGACLMSSTEVAMLMAPYAKYMVASEDSGYGLTRNWMAGIDQEESILAGAKRLVDSAFEEDMYVTQLKEEKGLASHPTTPAIAMVDLTKIAALVEAMNAYFPKLEAQASSAASFTKVSAQRRDATTFGIGESGGRSDYDLVDLGDLVEKTRDAAPAEADAVMAALKEAVVYYRAVNENCHGLTVYHPFVNKAILSGSIPIYNDLEFSEGYTNYVHRFVAYLTGTPLAAWKDLRTNARAEKDLRTLFTLSLAEDQAAHFALAQLETLLKHADGTYTLTFVNDHVAKEGNTLTSEFSGTALYAVAKDGSRLSPALDYTIANNGAYVIKGVLSRNAAEDQEAASYEALIYCGYDAETKALIPVSVMVWNERMQAYSFLPQIPFEEYDTVTLTLEYRKEAADENGTLLPFDQWEVVRTDEWAAPIDDTWGFRLVNDTLDTKDLYATFRVCDSQNNFYNSSLLQVKTEIAGDGASRVTYDDLGAVLIEEFFVTPAQNQLMVNVTLKNISEQETWFRLEGFCINGKAVEAKAEVFGSGANWGLLPGESQSALISLPLDGMEGEIAEITFQVVPVNAADNADQAPVPVQAQL